MMIIVFASLNLKKPASRLKVEKAKRPHFNYAILKRINTLAYAMTFKGGPRI